MTGAKSCGIIAKTSQEGGFAGSSSADITRESQQLKQANNVNKTINLNSPRMTPLILPQRKSSSLDQYETDETKSLTTAELQRLVLLEQLKTARIQREYFEAKLGRNSRNDLPARDITVEGSNTYINL